MCMFVNDRSLWGLSKSVGQCCRTCLLKGFMVSYFKQCSEYGLLNLLAFGDAEWFSQHTFYTVDIHLWIFKLFESLM
jgi:hypothetical protein